VPRTHKDSRPDQTNDAHQTEADSATQGGSNLFSGHIKRSIPFLSRDPQLGQSAWHPGTIVDLSQRYWDSRKIREMQQFHLDLIGSRDDTDENCHQRCSYQLI
jgi:hypothetical protein